MRTLSPKPRPAPSPFPFYQARLVPGFLDDSGDRDMSIVLLQGGGLTQDQLDRVPLSRKPLVARLAGWASGLFPRLFGKD